MSEQLLTVLKFCLLALIYLFFFRVLRAVWAEISPPAAPRTKGVSGRGRGSRRGGGVPAVAAPAPSVPTASEARAAALAPSVGPARGAAAPVPAQLVVLEPPEDRGRIYALDDEITVGRAAGCAVTVDDTYVSQVHARVFRRDGNYLVEDLGSTNGTYLNQKKVTGAMVMQQGDRLQIGNTVLELG